MFYNRKANKAFGLIFSFLGIVMFAAGVYRMIIPGIEPIDEAKLKATYQKHCTDSAKFLHVPVKVNRGNKYIESISAGLADADDKIARASLLINACQEGYDLNKFCVGEGCKVKGLYFSLKPKH